MTGGTRYGEMAASQPLATRRYESAKEKAPEREVTFDRLAPRLHRCNGGLWRGAKNVRAYCRLHIVRPIKLHECPACWGTPCEVGESLPACPDLSRCLHNAPGTEGEEGGE